MSLLGVDVGTSSCKALAIDLSGRVLATAGRAYQRSIPQPGWSEIDPQELLTAVAEVIRECAAKAASDPVQAISFSVFGGSFIALDQSGRPLCSLITTTDNRAAEDVKRWRCDFGARRTYEITGLIPHPSFLFAKALAFRRTHPVLFARARSLVSAEELIHSHLGLPAVCDSATASTYMACDLVRGDWSAEILSAGHIDRARMPNIVKSGSPIGEIGASIAADLELRPGVSVVAGGHDQQVASYGAGLTKPGAATDSLGTVEAISTVLASPQLDDRFYSNNLPNWKHVCGEAFYTIVYCFSCADLLNWSMRAFYGAEPGGELAPLKQSLEALSQKPARSLVLPHFCGSGTPHMDPASRGAIIGLDLATTPEEILRAVVDSQNYEMRLNLDIWRSVGIKVDRLRAYGGLAHSDALLQIKADILGVEVVRLECPEAGCLGAAVLAGVGAGLTDNPAELLRKSFREIKLFEPRGEFAAAHLERYESYRELYQSLSGLNRRLAEVDS